MTTLKEARQARRNLNPHAEAIAAMHFWSYSYAHEQRGGSMDFWDSLPEWKKNICRDAVKKIKAAPNEKPTT